MMKRVIVIFILFISLISPSHLKSQTASISLEVSDLTNLDLGGLVISKGLVNQPRIARLVILPQGKQVMVEIVVVWKKDSNSGFRQLFTFKSVPFLSRIVFNDDFGSTIDGNGTWDKDLVTDLVSKGKPTGIIGITARLYDVSNAFLSQDYKELVFLNPSPTISLIAPIESNSYDVGSVIAIWTKVPGATGYKILANIVPENSSSPEAALKGANPLIDNSDVGDVTSVDLRTILKREWFGGQKIVVMVTAVVPGNENGSPISTVPVTFILNKTGEVPTVAVSPELMKLIELITGDVNQKFIESILKGEISLDKIYDENNKSIDQMELMNLLNWLMQNKDSIVSIKFTPNQK